MAVKELEEIKPRDIKNNCNEIKNLLSLSPDSKHIIRLYGVEKIDGRSHKLYMEWMDFSLRDLFKIVLVKRQMLDEQKKMRMNDLLSEFLPHNSSFLELEMCIRA